MKLLWINDASASKPERLRGDIFSGVEVLDSTQFQGSQMKPTGEALVQAKLDEDKACILADSHIFGCRSEGFQLLMKFASHRNFVRGVLISTDLYPAPSASEWASQHSKFWRFQDESTEPSDHTCKLILRYFKNGTISFINPANEMLLKCDAAFRFAKELSSNDCIKFVNQWGMLGASVGESIDSMVPFCPRQSESGRLLSKTFPETFSEMESDLGIKISANHRKGEYPNYIADWKRILCPFESLRVAATGWPNSRINETSYRSSDAYGGALRLLWESARRATNLNVKVLPSEAMLKGADSVQRDWIQAQYELLNVVMQGLGPREYHALLRAASDEVTRALLIVAKYREEGA